MIGTSRPADMADWISRPLIAGGHQPELFHPGVWLKNAVLDAYARQVGGTAINLIMSGGGANSRLVKSGGGTLTLSRANTFEGDVTVNGGVLQAGNGGALVGSLGSTSATRTITVNGGATLRFAAHDAFGNAAANPANITVTVNGGTVESSNTFTTLGPLNLNGASLVDKGGANATYHAFQLKGTVTVSVLPLRLMELFTPNCSPPAAALNCTLLLSSCPRLSTCSEVLLLTMSPVSLVQFGLKV